MKEFLKMFVFSILIPILAGWTSGRVIGITIQKNIEKKEVKEIVQSLDEFSKRADVLKKEYDLAGADPAEYIIKSHTLFEMIYELTLDKRLLHTHREQFHRSCNLLHDIYQNQMEIIHTSNNALAIAGLTTITVLEMEKYSHLMEALTVVTCEETLKIDPGNQQAMDTLNKIYNKDRDEE